MQHPRGFLVGSGGAQSPLLGLGALPGEGESGVGLHQGSFSTGEVPVAVREGLLEFRDLSLNQHVLVFKARLGFLVVAEL